MAKTKTTATESATVTAINEILKMEINERPLIQGAPADDDKLRPATESEKVKAIKDYFNANVGSESESELATSLHAAAFNPSERDVEKIAKISSLLK